MHVWNYAKRGVKVFEAIKPLNERMAQVYEEWEEFLLTYYGIVGRHFVKPILMLLEFGSKIDNTLRGNSKSCLNFFP